MLSVSTTEGQICQKTATLGSGPYNKPIDHQVLDCLVGGESMVFDKSVASLLLTKVWPGCQAYPVTFFQGRLCDRNLPGCYRLIFQDRVKVMEMLGLNGTRRGGRMFLDDSLDYAAAQLGFLQVSFPFRCFLA